jgi:hypothetical protein
VKSASPFLSAALVAFLGAATVAFAQEPAHHHDAPPPSNLQVLPKTLTGEQVHEIMHKWAAALGTECTTCHAEDATRKMPNGRPMLNFADDSKPEKTTARLMARMVHDINSNYIGKLDNPGEPVSCATCHRGHLEPPPFVAPPDHDHDHMAPAPPSGMSGSTGR